MNRTRIAALERQFHLDDDLGVEMMAQIDEARRAEKWLAEQGYPDNARAALAAGLRVPKDFRFYSLEMMVRAEEQLAAWHWFIAWEYIAETRRRLDDPRFVFSREHDSEALDRLTGEAKQYRAKLQGWGIGLEAALQLARRIICESGGNVRSADEFAAIAALVRDAEPH